MPESIYHRTHHRPLAEKFKYKYVVNEDTGCWDWIGAKTNDGYGKMRNGDKFIYAHRYSASVHIGHIPSGMIVCHRCDNPGCVNPKHLFIGSIKDNMVDKATKGRGNTSHQRISVSVIKSIIDSPLSSYKEAVIHGISSSWVRYIRQRSRCQLQPAHNLAKS